MNKGGLTLRDALDTAQGFIFDCDGTLLDTIDAWIEAEADLFAQIRPLTDEEETEIHSAPIAETARLFHEEYGACDSNEAVLRHLNEHLLPFYQERCTSLPGAVDFVRKVYEKGIPCVVLSSSPLDYLEAGLEHVGILQCFKEIISTEEHNISKSDPALFEYALQVLGTKPEDTWGVDDAPYAIDVMRECGIRTIMVGKRAALADVRVPDLELHE